MKKGVLTVIAVAALALLFLVSGCVQQGETEPQLEKGKEVTQKDVSPNLPSKLRMGNLCSSLSECFVFCKSNVGRCTDFCAKNPSHNYCRTLSPAKPQTWSPNAITQPPPEGASKVRLVLPAPIDEIDLTTIGAYGAHPGGHAEGLDHEWISVKEGVPVGSWADGEVVYARLNHENDPSGEYRVIIYYGDGLWGEHMHVRQPLVKEGGHVKAGDPVAYGQVFEHSPGYHTAEFNVADQHRQDGVIYWYKFVKGATLVSPFDYLRDDVKQQLEEKYTKDVIETYVAKGDETRGVVPTPWEPYLTNPILLHREHEGTLIGEWYLRSKPWEVDRIPDIMVFLSANTKHYRKQRVLGTEDQTGEQFLSGDWEADYTNRRIVINTGSGVYYGIFELDESQPQARLKIEYRQGSYPTGFSEQANVYTERETISKAEEIHYWKHPEDRI